MFSKHCFIIAGLVFAISACSGGEGSPGNYSLQKKDPTQSSNEQATSSNERKTGDRERSPSSNDSVTSNVDNPSGPTPAVSTSTTNTTEIQNNDQSSSSDNDIWNGQFSCSEVRSNCKCSGFDYSCSKASSVKVRLKLSADGQCTATLLIDNEEYSKATLTNDGSVKQVGDNVVGAWTAQNGHISSVRIYHNDNFIITMSCP